MYWIEYRLGETIPQELYYDDWKTYKDRHDNTPLMFWIEYRLGEAIPEEMYYDGW